MLRVVFSLLGVALSFAALAYELNVGRAHVANVRAALGHFVGILGLGWPALFLYCKRRWWAAWQMVPLWMLVGALCALPYLDGPYAAGFLLLIYALAGAALGLLFWLGAIWRNDGLTCPKSFCLPCGTVYQVARKALHRRDLR